MEKQPEQPQESVVSNASTTPETTTPEVATSKIDEKKLQAYMQTLQAEENFPLAIVAAVITAFIGALLWATITVATEYQIGYMAVAIGFIVGYAVKFTGNGISQKFGILGAVFAFVGCILGNFFSIIGFVANSEGLGYFEVLGMLDYSLIPEIMGDSFSIMDLLFYGIAIYEGYRFSFRNITEEEIMANAAS